jgi:hypothetical protein
MRSIQSTALAFCAAALLVAGCAAQKPKSDDSKSQSQTQKDSGSGSKAPASGQQDKPAPAPESAGSNAMPEATRTASAANDATSGGGGRAQTPEERRAALDHRLEGSLGTFDDTLRREQKAVAEEKDANDADQAAANSSGDESGSAKPEGLPAEASEPGRSRNETPARPGDLKSDKDREANDNKPGGGSGASGDKIPDGSDDDIVAKRLRKAAEQETDPELKEKLWKEYIEYKKNAGK